MEFKIAYYYTTQMIFMCVCICKGVGNSGFLNQLLGRQDGRVEGCELTSSYENTTITSN